MIYEDTHLEDLRRLARKIGVKSPTSYNKNQLIVKILEVESGFVAPVFSKKGRPIKKREVQENVKDTTNIGVRKETLFLIIEEVKKFLGEIETILKNDK